MVAPTLTFFHRRKTSPKDFDWEKSHVQCRRQEDSLSAVAGGPPTEDALLLQLQLQVGIVCCRGLRRRYTQRVDNEI